METAIRSRARRGGRALLVAGLAAALFVMGGIGLFRTVRSEAPAVSTRLVPALAGRPVVTGGTLARTIASLQDRLKALPQDFGSWSALGLAYVQQARVTADPGFYPKAEEALNRSLSESPTGNFQALTGLAALAAARHDFGAALAFGRRAEAINPDNANVHGVMGDALIELGRYPEAFGELQRMIDLRPGLSSYARVSYARELQGDPAGAMALMRQALDYASSAGDRAWASNQIGELAFNAGDLATAERSYRFASEMDPTFFPARAGLAKVAAARGETGRAIAAYHEIVAAYPLPEYVVALADLQTAAGRTTDAEGTIGLLRVEEKLFEANGVNVDLEIALFDADHGLDLAAGLDAARSEWARRRSVHVADALAWALYANGRYDEAITYSNEALALGTRNASFLFHRGMIERALGRTAAAKKDLRAALALNPHFSILWSAKARTILKGMA
jgi:tetratricopeptide (TPR) repeat protein